MEKQTALIVSGICFSYITIHRLLKAPGSFLASGNRTALSLNGASIISIAKNCGCENPAETELVETATNW